MSLSNKERLEHELVYAKNNDCYESVCCGKFYISNKKKYEVCEYKDHCSKYKLYGLMKDYAPNVKFRHVESFRRCILFYRYEINEQAVMKNTTYNIQYMNELALSWIVDLKTYMRDMDAQSKKIVGAVLKRARAYERDMRNILEGSIYKYCDICDEMDEIFRPKVKKMLAMMQLNLMSKGVKNYKLVGYLEFIRFLLCFSSDIRTKNIEFASVLNKNVLYLRVYSLNELVPILDNLIRWTLRNDDRNKATYNDDKLLMDAFTDLRTNAIDLKNIQKCISNYENNEKD